MKTGSTERGRTSKQYPEAHVTTGHSADWHRIREATYEGRGG